MATARSSDKLTPPEQGRKSLPEIARQWSKAIERGKGLRISAEDLDELNAIGVNDLLQVAAANQLKEKALCRASRGQTAYIDVENTGLIGTVAKTEAYEVRSSRSSGMTHRDDASALLARVQTTLRLPAKP